MFDCGISRVRIPITGIVRVKWEEMNEGREKRTVSSGKKRGRPKRRIYKLGTKQRYRTMDKRVREPVTDMEKSSDNESSRRNGLANLWNMAASRRTWRFIGLIVTRAKRRRRRCALENFCPVKIFSPGRDGTEPEQNESRTKKERPRSKTETSMLWSRRRKVDGWEFAVARFMDYRSSV